MGLPFHFSAGEGPVIEKPVRSHEDISRLRTDRAADGLRLRVGRLGKQPFRKFASRNWFLRRPFSRGKLHDRRRRI